MVSQVNSRMALPTISTVILNWNRADLLERCISSYLETITVPFELLIIDNASEDESKVLIEKFCSHLTNVRAIYLPSNQGGEAINVGLAQSAASLFHVSENDIEYLPDWDHKVLDVFQSFPSLGQLSLFGPVPEDDEAWVVKPSLLRHSHGRIIYEAVENIGTTCILRRELWDTGIRFASLPVANNFRFPDDIRFSESVKKAGYMVAWSDHYLVKNLGHNGAEFQSRAEYYQRNYQSKPWMGVEGWRERLSKWKRQPKPKRQSFLFSHDKTSAEKSEPTVECTEPQLWSMFDGWTAELEVIEFLYAIVRLVKPKFAVETGTWHGLAAAAIGRALKDNGRGKLVTLEIDRESYQVAAERITNENAECFVDVLNTSSLSYVPKDPIDFLLLDSDLSARGREFQHFRAHLRDGAIVLFHDTSKRHKVVHDEVDKLISDKVLSGFFVDCPRGLGVFRFIGASPQPSNSLFRAARKVLRKF